VKDDGLARHVGELQVTVHRCSAFHTLPRRAVNVSDDMPTLKEDDLGKKGVSHAATYVTAVEG
jgi:hypothetical protein